MNNKVKKIPIRLCLGCNEKKPKKELIRIVKSPEGEISIDLQGKKNGRGAYICNNIDCLNKLFKNKRLSKALDCEIKNEVFEKLKNEMSENE